MKWLRFDLRQLLLVSALFGLLTGAAATGQRDIQYRHVRRIAVSPSGNRIAALTPDAVLLWDISGPVTRRRTCSLDVPYPGWWLRRALFAFDGESRLTLGSIDGNTSLDGITRWDVETDRELSTARPPSGWRIDLDEREQTANARFVVWREGNQIAILDIVNDQTRRHVASFPMREYAVAPHAPRAVAMSDDGEYELFDLENARSIRTWRETSMLEPEIESSPPDGLRMLPDGRHFYYTKTTKDQARIVIVPADGGAGQVHSVVKPNAYLYDDVAHLLPDLKRLALATYYTELTVSHLQSGGATKVPLLSRHFDMPVFSGDGSTMVEFDDRVIAVHRGENFGETRVLWRAHTRSMFAYGAALVAWSAVWAWNSWRRDRRRYLDNIRGINNGHLGRWTQVNAPDWMKRHSSPTLSAVAIGVALTISLTFGVAIILAGNSEILCIVVGIGAFALVVVASVLSSSRFPAATLREASRAVGVDGQLHSFDRLTIWSNGERGDAWLAITEYQRTLRRFRRLIGANVCPTAPLFVLMFDRHEQMERYLGRRCGLSGVFKKKDGLHRIVFCRSSSTDRLVDPRHTIRSLFAYELMVGRYYAWPEWWLMLVVSHGLSYGDTYEPRDSAQDRFGVLMKGVTLDGSNPSSDADPPRNERHYSARQIRRLQAAFDRGNDVRLDTLLRLSNQDVQRLIQGAGNDLATQIELSELLAMAATLHELLQSDEPPFELFRLRALLTSLTQNSLIERVFEKTYEMSYDELDKRWREWIASRPQVPTDAAPPWLREELQRAFLPATMDVERSVEERAAHIAQLGAAGYVDGVPPLFEFLDDPQPVLRRAARWSLESIRGKAFHSSPPDESPSVAEMAEWRRWFDEVNAELLSANGIEFIEPTEATATNSSEGNATAGQQVPTVDRQLAVAKSSPLHANLNANSFDADHINASHDERIDAKTQIVARPPALTSIWVASAISGMFAVGIAMPYIYDAPRWFLILPMLQALAGVFILSQIGSRRSARLRLSAVLQIATILSCNVPGLVCGIVCLSCLMVLPVRWHLTVFERVVRLSPGEQPRGS